MNNAVDPFHNNKVIGGGSGWSQIRTNDVLKRLSGQIFENFLAFCYEIAYFKKKKRKICEKSLILYLKLSNFLL